MAFRSGKTEPIQFGIKYFHTNGVSGAILSLVPEVAVKRLEIQTADSLAAYRYKGKIRARKEESDDYRILAEAYEYLNHGNYEIAKELLHDYEKYCRKNPEVSYSLSQIYMKLKEYSNAEEYALKATTGGIFDDGVNLYRSIQDEKDSFKPPDEVKSLKEQAAAWPPEPHYGVVVLEKNQRFLLGLGEWHFKSCSEIMMIRRQSAARMLTAVTFNFDARKEIVLSSKLRILNSEFQAENVSEENIFFNDSPKRNIYITGEELRECGWILPDLAVGDIIEWNYSMLSRDRSDESELFILTDINHPHFPTFESEVIFDIPPDFVIDLSSRDGAPDGLEKSITENGKTRYRLGDSRYVPSKNTGFYYENNHLNPVFGCACGVDTWKSLSDKIKKDVLGEHFDSEKMPAPLQNIIERNKDTKFTLENCYYWIRDKIKYGSLPSGARQIGKMGRADEIIQAGIGDCNDKSYLLGLVCKHLEIPFEIIAVSAGQGVVFKNLPAHQFDHVFIRAMPADKWLYMDAAASYSVFGQPPAYLQGLDALFINGDGHLEVITEDSAAANQIEISETIGRISDGWVETEFDIHSTGFIARSMDENLKSISLTFEDQNQAAQESLRNLIPSLIVTDFEKTRNTADSNFCNLSCRGKRCQVISLGNKSAANVRWHIPTLPIAQWRACVNEKLFVFSFPQSIRLILILTGEIFDALTDISNIPDFSNDICVINETSEKGPDYLKITRQMEIKKKYIYSEHMNLFPEIMANIERAMQMVAIFDR